MEPNYQKIAERVREARARGLGGNGFLVVGLDGEKAYRYSALSRPPLADDEATITIPNNGVEVDAEWVKWKLHPAVRTEPPATREPITLGGWYEHTDGTIGHYRWTNGRLSCDRTVAGWADVPDRTQELIDADRESR